MAFRLPPAASVIENPSPEEVKELAARMPTARRTAYGNLNVQTEVLSRSKRSTFLVTDEPDGQNQSMTREEGLKWAEAQDAYIAEQEMVVIDGYIGIDPDFRTPTRLYIEAANANIAGMQQQLYFDREESGDFEPELVVIYTPNLRAESFPDDRLIAVDLEQGVTRVFNSDYFGESKKGGLRMWNKVVYDRGGLPLHAGCKVIPTERGERVGMIVGLSGTGKTTTTFTRQNRSLPVQDDFVAWMPNGHIYVTENGCFAKTFGLNPDDEPTIHGAVTQPDSYLENVSQHGDEVDFFDTSYTHNGRATFPFRVIESAAERSIDDAHFLLILNRNENIIPAVAKLEGPRAAAFFMLGETQGTSAGGADEAGKFLRVPGTNPFFPMPHDLQGNRFLELLEAHPLEVYLMNTGRVGGPEEDERSKKVRIKHSSAIVKGIAEGTIRWEQDPDFGYLVAGEVPGIDAGDVDVLQPRRLYESTGRAEDYRALVQRFKSERAEFLSEYASLSDEIVAAVR
ncbi:MAG TPA: phosphoenolpyruvate carboxykinase [Gaiellaceae bacterium]|jgi:phosphoenolpyruvate carboxykinase (ATP)|nr:phosphoenolpyruvate carboxykinase [Gaiellaceae bacterium]